MWGLKDTQERQVFKTHSLQHISWVQEHMVSLRLNFERKAQLFAHFTLTRPYCLQMIKVCLHYVILSKVFTWIHLYHSFLLPKD